MKLKKLAAVVMTAALAVTSLAACGNDEKENAGQKKIGSFGEAFAAGAELEDVTYEGKFKLSMSGDEFVDIDEAASAILGDSGKIEATVTLSGANVGDKAKAKVGINVNDKLKADLIDVLYLDKTVYLSVDTLADGITGMVKDITGEDVSEQISALRPEGDYLKLTEDTLKELLESAGNISYKVTDIAGMTDELSAEEAEKYTELAEYFVDLLDKGIKKGAKDAYSKDGDTYKITINNGNINKIAEGLSEVISSKSTEVAKKLNGILGKDTVDADSISSMASLIKNYDIAELLGADFEVVLSTSYKDNTWTVGASVSIEADGNKTAISFDCKATKADKLDIKAPEDVISDEDTQALIALISGMADGGLDDMTDDDMTDDDMADDDDISGSDDLEDTDN